MNRVFAAFALSIISPALYAAATATASAAKSDYAGEYKTRTETNLYPKPRMDVAPIATLPAGSKVTLSGKQESVLAEAVDSKGRHGWVSIQDIAW
jgi:uncharacterized protein YgiM (DUF1202 family)